MLLQSLGVVTSSTGFLTISPSSPLTILYASCPTYLWLNLLSSIFHSMKFFIIIPSLTSFIISSSFISPGSTYVLAILTIGSTEYWFALAAALLLSENSLAVSLLWRNSFIFPFLINILFLAETPSSSKRYKPELPGIVGSSIIVAFSFPTCLPISDDERYDSPACAPSLPSILSASPGCPTDSCVIIPATSGPTMTSNFPGVNFFAFLSILTIVPASSFTLSKNLPSLKTSHPPDLPVCTNLCTTLPESIPVSTANRPTLGTLLSILLPSVFA